MWSAGDLFGQYARDCSAAQVSFEDFEAYMRKASRRMHAAFDALDAEHKGYLTEAGLLQALRAMGFPAKGEDARRMIELLDKSHDQCISYAEFVRFACLLPEVQLANNNVASCWVDSTDFVDGVEFRLSMVRRCASSFGASAIAHSVKLQGHHRVSFRTFSTAEQSAKRCVCCVDAEQADGAAPVRRRHRWRTVAQHGGAPRAAAHHHDGVPRRHLSARRRRRDVARWRLAWHVQRCSSLGLHISHISKCATRFTAFQDV